jgi:ABC-type glycerol-3-phosphate transport system substrate-binding protein
MHRNWPYAVAISGQEKNLGEKMGVMPMPYGVPEGEGKYEDTGGSVAALGGWHIAVNPNTKRKEAALEVLKTLTKDEFMIDNFGINGHMPPVSEVLRSDAAKEVPVMGRYVDTLAYAGDNMMPRPVTVLWPQQSEKIEQAANSALSDTAPEKAMSGLKEDLRAIENSV